MLTASSTEAPSPEPDVNKILLPIWLAVFVQMLGVGVTLATLPLMMTQAGVSPTRIGITISCFSAAQMIGCPLLVGLSARTGISQLTVLRACLMGNALAAIGTAVAGGWRGITCARILAGFFAASVPVAQVAVADVVPPGPQTSKALSRVASAARPAGPAEVVEVVCPCGLVSTTPGRRHVGVSPGSPEYTQLFFGLLETERNP